MDFCTTDHSIVQQLSNKMAITSSIYEKYAAIVTRAIMGDEIKEEIPIEVLSIAEGDTFLYVLMDFISSSLLKNTQFHATR